MFDAFYALLFGAVQGITEFFPISSSAHLLFLHRVIPLSFANELAFDVALHVGTLGALLLVFWKDIARYSIAFFRWATKRSIGADADLRMAWWLLLGTVPAVVVGVVAGNVIESVLRSTLLAAVVLVGVGLLFFPAEKLATKARSLEHLTWKDALVIGCAQALALVPGVSRSGITLLAGFGRGMTREAAARFSFLLAIPVVFVAGIKEGYTLLQTGVVHEDIAALVVGLVSSLVVGFIVIRYFLRFVRTHTLLPFAWYRIVAGVFVLGIIAMQLF